MARARILKPSFFVNEDLAKIQPLGRLLFEALWCHAGSDGKLEDRPARLKIQCLPYDSCDVDTLLQELHEAGFIIRYSACGRQVIKIPCFSEHANPHPKEPESGLPEIEPGLATAEPRQKISCIVPVQPSLSKKILPSNRKSTSKGKREEEEKTEQATGLPEHCPPLPEGLDTPPVRQALNTWAAYKRKRGEKYKSSHGWTALLREFEPLGANAFCRAIDASMRSNYSGVFPARDPPKTTPRAADSSHNVLVNALKSKANDN